MIKSVKVRTVKFALLVTLLGLIGVVPAFATFSIVAVDTITGAVGGAGASCIDGSVVINDCIEGIGASHTQAYYLVQNKTNLHNLMLAGIAPDSIIHWLENNDYEGTPGYRQYGVVTLANHGASAGYTGSVNTPWAGHITGPGYPFRGIFCWTVGLSTQSRPPFFGPKDRSKRNLWPHSPRLTPPEPIPAAGPALSRLFRHSSGWFISEITGHRIFT